MKKNRILENQSILYTLQTADPKLSRAIIKNSRPEIVELLCEIIYNILRGNVKLTPKIQSKLKQYKRKLRCMVCRKRSISSKRKILNQKGGAVFLPLILGSVLSGLAGSIADKFLNK